MEVEQKVINCHVS